MGYRATLYDLANKRQLEVYLEGEAFRTDRHVGGGPIPPGPGGGDPPGIWGGPIDPYPDHGLPQPPGTWPPQRPPHPAHPIVLPPEGGTPPIDPPTEPPTNPPSANWVWGWSPKLPGWTPVYVPGDGSKPSPIPTPPDPNAPTPTPQAKR